MHIIHAQGKATYFYKPYLNFLLLSQEECHSLQALLAIMSDIFAVTINQYERSINLLLFVNNDSDAC